MVQMGTMDPSARPGDDFYRYVNGDWISDHPVPPDKTAIDVFTELSDRVDERLRSLVEDAARNPDAGPGSLSRKIGDLYRTGMDTGSIERLGLTPLEKELDRINRMSTVSDVQAGIARLVTCGIAPCFGLFAETDPKNSTMMIAGLEQGGLGLPNRKYYLNEDPESEAIRIKYQDHIAKMFGLLGIGPAFARADAKTVTDMETRLAGASFSPEENRDPDATYHTMSPAGLKEIAPGMDWDSFFSAIGYPGIREINVHQPQFFQELSEMLSAIGAPQWKVFLRWKLISALAPFLDSRFE